MTRDHIAEQIRARRWQLVAPEVVSVDNGRLDRVQQRWRAVLHAPTSWVSGRSGLEVLGLTGVVIHVSDRLDRLDPLLERGLPVVPAARAIVDAVAWSPHSRGAAGILLDALRQGLTTPQAVDHELGLAGRIHRKVAAREALSAWREGAESLAEVDVGPLLRRAGTTRLRRQVRAGTERHDVEAVLADGTILVVEVDGAAHESAERRWKDAERDADTLAEGKRQLRIPALSTHQRLGRGVMQVACVP